MKKVIVVLLIGIGFWSCQPKCTDDPDLTADELSWLPYYNGQMIIFKNDTGSIDTGFAQVYFATGSCKTDDNGCQHCNQFGSNELKNFTPIPLGEFDINIAHYNQWFPDNNYVPFPGITPQNNVVLNGRTFNNVYISSGDYFTKQYGWIAFTTGGGVL